MKKKKVFIAIVIILVLAILAFVAIYFVQHRTPVLTEDCDKVQNQDKKDACYWKVAEVKEDVSICDKIQGQEWKNVCYTKFR